MNQKPFTRRWRARDASQSGLPDDLAEFYSKHEGVGLESDPSRHVRLCLLSEVAPIHWADLQTLGSSPCPPGWESFAGFRIGISSFFDEFVYVTESPCCPSGAILIFGADILGPAGSGSAPLEESLVVGRTFAEWLEHLAENKWFEWGLYPGNVLELSPAKQKRCLHYYQSLNPEIDWANSAEEG